MKHSYIWCLMILLFVPWLLGGISVKASVNKYTITSAERLEYTIEVSSESSFSMSEPSPPSIPNFSFVNMRSSSSSSTSIVGFKRTQRISRSFVYYFMPKSEGKSKIPAQKIEIANKVYSTPEFEITVVKAVGGWQSQPSPAIDPFAAFNDPNLPWSANRIQGKTVLVARLPQHTVYRGQPLIVSYYLITDQMVRSFKLEDERDFPGYGKSIYEQPNSLEYEVVNYEGKRFQSALIKKLVLLPNEVGKLQVPRLQGTARIYEFGYLSQTLSSQEEYFEVLSLPVSNVPEGFGGAVGSFELSESINAKQINLGEAITLSLRIAGKGNFNQFANPSLESAAAQISNPLAVDRINAGIEGSRILQYTIVPSNKGVFRMPGLKFSWFDPASRSYHSYQSPRTEITVNSANVISYFSGLLEGSSPKTLRPMLSRPSYPQYRSYLHRTWYWLIVALLGLAIVISVWQAIDKKRRRSDPALYLRNKAARNLKRWLRESNEAAKRGSRDFYALAERSLARFLFEKYSIPIGLSTADKLQKLSEAGINPDLLQRCAAFFERCAKARFSPDEIQAIQISEDMLTLNQLVMSFVADPGKGEEK